MPEPGRSEPPPRPSSQSQESVGFKCRKGMVRWLSPKELAATAVRVLLSSVFGAYSDKREIQAALPREEEESYAGEDELWVDYVADLGDAFGPTYAVASLLARPELDLDLPRGERTTTCRGRLLVMGGDEVYPTPSITDYRDHTLGPYRAALPWSPEDKAPHLYAIPGNHDWYDGLTAFMRVFCRQQWVGGWKTRQHRSYFAVQLREDWWLWGIDIQLDSYVDEPQFRYFEEVAGRLDEGDSVILCSAVPSWVEANQGNDHPEAFSTLDYFERKLIRDRGAEVRLALSGDAHHYAHYVRDDGRTHRLTAGGGGAFLAATHNLPEALELPPPASREVGKTKPPECFSLVTAYPSKAESRRLRWRVAALPYQNWSMAGLIGGVHLLYAWMIQSVLRSGFSAPSGAGANEAPDLSRVMPSGTTRDLYRAVLRSPLAIVLSTLVTWGMSGLTKSKDAKKRAAGALHGLLHVGLAVGTISAASDFLHRRGWKHLRFLAGFGVLVGGGGGLLGSWLLAAYLFVADRYLRCNTNELFASQRNRDHKNFLRIHFDRDGGVTVYPVKVAHTPRQWTLRKQGSPTEPWFVPEDGRICKAELIEEPIRIGLRAGGPPGFTT